MQINVLPVEMICTIMVLVFVLYCTMKRPGHHFKLNILKAMYAHITIITREEKQVEL